MMGLGRNWYYGMMDNGWGWIMMFGFLLLVVVGIFLVVKYLNNPGNSANSTSSTNSSKSSALDVLNERYARGEILSEEYEKMKSQISK